MEEREAEDESPDHPHDDEVLQNGDDVHDHQPGEDAAHDHPQGDEIQFHEPEGEAQEHTKGDEIQFHEPGAEVQENPQGDEIQYHEPERDEAHSHQPDEESHLHVDESHPHVDESHLHVDEFSYPGDESHQKLGDSVVAEGGIQAEYTEQLMQYVSNHLANYSVSSLSRLSSVHENLFPVTRVTYCFLVIYNFKICSVNHRLRNRVPDINVPCGKNLPTSGVLIY